MNRPITFLIFLITINTSISQQDFIQIETNKTLCLFSFLETASQQLGTSISFAALIEEAFKHDSLFQQIVASYSQLNLDYSFRREEFPEERHSYKNTRDLLWTASSNATSIEDFSDRIIGYLPHSTHISFIQLLQQAEPYYNSLIWNDEQENITRIEQQLAEYKNQIADLYLRISNFYGTNWDKSIPFKIMLYPIPLAQGNTTAIPKGNALICSFLSHKEDDYKIRLGIIIHEMCHILFDEQPIKFQQEINDWFGASDSDFSKLAYSYLDEGLATVLGNGWAYHEIHQEDDADEWYNDKYIDGFAKSLYPITKRYMANGTTVDKAYVDNAIELFSETFPKAINKPSILFNELLLFANSEEDKLTQQIFDAFASNFKFRSLQFSTPINDSKSLEYMAKESATKVFILESNQTSSLQLLNKEFEELAIKTPENHISILKDPHTKSPVIVIHLDELKSLNLAIAKLKGIDFFEFGKTISF